MQRFFSFLVILFAVLAPPSTADGSPPAGRRVVLLGDFLPAGSAEGVIAARGFPYLFGGVRHILADSDGVFLNLEAPLSHRGTSVEGKTYTFRAEPEAAEAMFAEGVRSVSLANNHILDFGPEALEDTLAFLREAGVSPAGAGMDLAEAGLPAEMTAPPGNLLLLAFSNTFPDSYWAGESRPGTLFGSPGTVRRAVAAASVRGTVIVSFHWGQELMETPKDYQVDLARLAIDSGAAMVVGHHPHVLQPIEVYRGRVILYSLGNFSFGSYSRNARHGLMARAEFTPEGLCSGVEIYPLLVDNTVIAFRPRILTGDEGRGVFDRLTAGIPKGAADVRWAGDRGILLPTPR